MHAIFHVYALFVQNTAGLRIHCLRLPVGISIPVFLCSVFCLAANAEKLSAVNCFSLAQVFRPGKSIFSPEGTAMTHFFRRTFAVGLLVACLFAGSVLPSVSAAPTFDSGSTGADGAFAPTANVILQVPDSGVFNFTTVNIPNGVTVTFTRNANNTPVTILASGNVTIAGGINIVGGAGSNVVNGTNNNIGTFRSTGGAGGPGGFDGGGGGGYVAPFTGVAGDGPGGGGGGLGTLDLTIEGGGAGGGFSSAGANANNIVNGISYSGGVKGGVMYGSSVLLPLVGGSGGGGGGATSQYSGGSGGGGGGAILIACSGTTSLSGQVSANGGDGGYGYNGGGGGSGGAIRVIATTLAGLATVDVRGGSGGVRSSYYYGGGGAPGYIRFEAYNFNNFNPLVVGGQGVAKIGRAHV